MKYGIRKFYDADPVEKPAALTADILMKELNTIKGALEKNQKETAEKQEKNWQDKLDAANEAIENLKSLNETKEKDNADKLKAIQTDLDITLKAFDKLQLRLKADANTSYGAKQEDTSLSGQIFKAFGGFRDKVTKGTISKGENEATLQMKALTDMSVVNSISTGVVPNTYRTGIVPLPFEMVHLRDIVNVTPSETDSYHFYRHTGGDGQIDWQVQELATKQQIDEDFNETTVNLDYLAGWLRISRKMLRNFKGLQAYITRWLPERYYQQRRKRSYIADESPY